MNKISKQVTLDVINHLKEPNFRKVDRKQNGKESGWPKQYNTKNNPLPKPIVIEKVGNNSKTKFINYN